VRKRGEMSGPGKLKKTESAGKPMKGKYASESASEMAEVVLPAQTNALGKLLGGHVMHMVDIVAAMAACRHANSYMVTASVDYIDFRNSVSLGEIVMLKSQVNRVFQTSLEVGVEVHSEDILTGVRKQTTTAYVTFVAIDEHTRLPKRVPPLLLRTAAERRRWKEAAKRREIRLALRQKRG
jgi:acyl-CoA hydrolase